MPKKIPGVKDSDPQWVKNMMRVHHLKIIGEKVALEEEYRERHHQLVIEAQGSSDG